MNGINICLKKKQKTKTAPILSALLKILMTNYAQISVRFLIEGVYDP